MDIRGGTRDLCHSLSALDGNSMSLPKYISTTTTTTPLLGRIHQDRDVWVRAENPLLASFLSDKSL
jgi:hypothetical protein